jgi:thiamine-phosphate pyrophosphorylase
MKGLLFITHQTEKFDYLQSVEIALQGGCKQIQLRMKDLSEAETIEKASVAKELCDKYNADLYIDDYVDVCKRVRAKGVHLGKNDISVVEARNILGNDFIIGGTANTFDDIKFLNENGADYIGLGPFRFTTTKKNLSPVLGVHGYRDIVNKCRSNNMNLPILAIGGITIDDISDIMSTGVAGIALSSTILKAAEPVKQTEKIVKIINKYL